MYTREVKFALFHFGYWPFALIALLGFGASTVPIWPGLLSFRALPDKMLRLSTIVAETGCGCIGPWDPLGFGGLIHNTSSVAWLFLTGGEFGAGNFPST
jgi:hypothetical protein